MRLTLTIVASIAIVGCSASTTVQPPTVPVPTVTIAPTTTSTTTTTTTTLAPTTTTTLVPADAKCAELAPIASAAGWPQELLIDVLEEAWSESRCLNIIGSVHGQPAHKNWNGWDWGPMQINKVWLDDIENKYGDWRVVADPYYNFAWAWEMYIWFDAHRGCGFDPWTRPCK
jgi:hypothetical protein